MYSRRRPRRIPTVANDPQSAAIQDLQIKEARSEWYGAFVAIVVFVPGLLILDALKYLNGVGFVIVLVAALSAGVTTYVTSRPKKPKPAPPITDPMSYEAVYHVDGTKEPR